MNKDQNKQPDTHKENRHESGRGGSAEGAGDKQTQKQVRDGHMPFNGLDYEEQQKRALDEGLGGNKKSENQAGQ